MIGIDKILALVNQKNSPLIENISERERNNPEGAGIDLRVGIVSKLMKSKSFLGIDERSTLNSEKVAEFDSDQLSSYLLKP